MTALTSAVGALVAACGDIPTTVAASLLSAIDSVRDATPHGLSPDGFVMGALREALRDPSPGATGQVCGDRSGAGRNRECLLPPDHDGWHEGLGSAWSRGQS